MNEAKQADKISGHWSFNCSNGEHVVLKAVIISFHDKTQWKKGLLYKLIIGITNVVICYGDTNVVKEGHWK